MVTPPRDEPLSRKERRREKKLGAAASAAAPAADSREALARATRLHQAGRLEEAQGIYLRVLKREPENADALSLMGLLAHQAGRNDVAAELLGKALAVRPRRGGVRAGARVRSGRRRRPDQPRQRAPRAGRRGGRDRRV